VNVVSWQRARLEASASAKTAKNRQNVERAGKRKKLSISVKAANGGRAATINGDKHGASRSAPLNGIR